MPSDALTIASASSGILETPQKSFRGTTSSDDISVVATRTQDVQTRLAINWPCVARMVKSQAKEITLMPVTSFAVVFGVTEVGRPRLTGIKN